MYITLCCSLATVVFAHPSSRVEWIRQLGTAAVDRASSLAVVERSHAVYLSGQTIASDNASTQSAFIARYGATGRRQWIVQPWPASSSQSAAAVVSRDSRDVDQHAEVAIFAAGHRDGALSDAFVVRLRAKDGTTVWDTSIATPLNDYASALASSGTAPSAPLFVVGRTFGALASRHSFGGNDAFVARIESASGKQTWMRQFGTPSSDAATGVAAWGEDARVEEGGGAAIDETESSSGVTVAVCGFTFGAFDQSSGGFDTVVASGPRGARDAFVAAFDGDGKRQWLHQFGTAAADSAQCIASVQGEKDLGRLLFVGGRTSGDLKAGLTKVDPRAPPPPAHSATPSAAKEDAWVARLNPNDGAVLWLQQFGTPGEESVEALSVSPRGIVYAVGSTSSALHGEVSNGGRDGFVVAFDADGRRLWTRLIGGWGTDSAMATVFAPPPRNNATELDAGTLWLAGATNSALDTVEDAPRAVASTDVFLCKLALLPIVDSVALGSGRKGERIRNAATFRDDSHVAPLLAVPPPAPLPIATLETNGTTLARANVSHAIDTKRRNGSGIGSNAATKNETGSAKVEEESDQPKLKQKSKTGGYLVDPRGVMALKEEHRPRYSTSTIDYGPFISTRWVRLPVDLSALNEGVAVGDAALFSHKVRNKLGLKALKKKKKKKTDKMCPCPVAGKNGSSFYGVKKKGGGKNGTKGSSSNSTKLCPCSAPKTTTKKKKTKKTAAKTAVAKKKKSTADASPAAASTREEAALLLSQGATFDFLAQSMQQFGFNVTMVAAIPPTISPNGDLVFSILVTDFRASTFGKVERTILAAALSTKLNIWDDQITVEQVTNAAEPSYLGVLRGLLQNASSFTKVASDDFALHRKSIDVAAAEFSNALLGFAGSLAAVKEAPSMEKIYRSAVKAAQTSEHLTTALEDALQLTLVRPRSGVIYGEERELSFAERRAKENRLDAEQLRLCKLLRRALFDGATKARTATKRSVQLGVKSLRLSIIGEPPQRSETNETVRLNASALLRVVTMGKSGVLRNVAALSFNMSGVTRAMRALCKSTLSLRDLVDPTTKGASESVPLNQVADELDVLRDDVLALQAALPSTQTETMVASVDMLFARLSKSYDVVNTALRSALFRGKADSSHRRRSLLSSRGGDDPITAMATRAVQVERTPVRRKAGEHAAALSRIPFVRRLLKGIHVTAVISGVTPPLDDTHAKMMIEAAYQFSGHDGVQVHTLVRATKSAWSTGVAKSSAKRSSEGGQVLQMVHFISLFTEKEFDATDRLTYTLGLENYLRSATSKISSIKVSARIVGVVSGVHHERLEANVDKKTATTKSSKSTGNTKNGTTMNSTEAAGKKTKTKTKVVDPKLLSIFEPKGRSLGVKKTESRKKPSGFQEDGIVVAIRIRGLSSSSLHFAPAVLPTSKLSNVGGGKRGIAGTAPGEASAAMKELGTRELVNAAQLGDAEYKTLNSGVWDGQAAIVIAGSIVIIIVLFCRRAPWGRTSPRRVKGTLSRGGRKVTHTKRRKSRLKRFYIALRKVRCRCPYRKARRKTNPNASLIRETRGSRNV